MIDSRVIGTGRFIYMATVKGSKQFKMVVVRSRPGLKFLLVLLAMTIVAALVYGSYLTGKEEGLALKVSVVQERDSLQAQLDASNGQVITLRQKIADIELGDEIDTKATEAVRQTVESLQQEIADLREEVRFYKSVLMPNVDEKGLRIERLELKATGDPRKVRYNLLLTQVVDKHEFIQGGVVLNLIGTRGGQTVSVPFDQWSEANKQAIGFRFRYFQNMEGELLIPNDFVPLEIEVVATSQGQNGRRLERRFSWKILEG
jgi:hypothetical protein